MNFFKIFIFFPGLFLSVVLPASGDTRAKTAISRCAKPFRSLKNSNTGREQESARTVREEDAYSLVQKEVKNTAESFLERSLTESEVQALINAYYVTLFLPKTLDYLKEPEQKWILEKAGFSKTEVELILFYELLGNYSDALKMPEKVLAQQILDGTISAKENNWVYTIGIDYFLKTQNSIGNVGRIIRSIPGHPPKIVLELPSPKTGKIVEVTVDVNTINTQKKEVEIAHYEKGNDYHIYTGVPEISRIFASYRSDRKTLSMKALNLSENMPLGLGTEGIGPKHLKEWPAIQEQIAFGKALRKLKVPPHPHKTHVEYFTIKIPFHISYIRSGITRSKFLSKEQKQNALERLKILEQEAKRAMREKAVTYVWWLKFNLNLARIISGEEIIERTGDHFSHPLYESIALFPVMLALPIINGELGKATLSRAFSNGIAPVGLVTKPTKDANSLLSPIDFAMHDLSHITDTLIRTFDYSHLLIQQTIESNVHLKFMETLSGQERKQAEDTYFNYVHE